MGMAHVLAYSFLGAGVGFAYQRLVGCRTGTCPITSNRYVATIYGAFMGFIAAGGLR
jgi:hypothetical protein